MLGAIQKQNPADEDTEKVRALIQRCSTGDPDALKWFFNQYAEDIYNFPMRVFHFDEDSASDFFLYAYERLRNGKRFKSWQGRSTFRTWFFTVLRNLSIDWVRAQRELQTVSNTQENEEGYEMPTIDEIIDPRSVEETENRLLEPFLRHVKSLNVDSRLFFKLSFIYYLNLDQEEFERLSERTKKPIPELIRQVADLQGLLAERGQANICTEDKITSLYLSILHHKEQLGRLIEQESQVKSETGNRKVKEEIARLNYIIQKKYLQRQKLLERKEKGHFVIRTPQRLMGQVMNTSEGNVSLQTTQALNTLRDLILNEESVKREKRGSK